MGGAGGGAKLPNRQLSAPAVVGGAGATSIHQRVQGAGFSRMAAVPVILRDDKPAYRTVSLLSVLS